MKYNYYFVLLFTLIFIGCHNNPSKEEQRDQLDSMLLNEVKIPVKTGTDTILATSVKPFDDGVKAGTITTEAHRLTAEMEKFVAFDPNAQGLFPGSLVQGKGLPNGILTPVTTKRNPLTITISDFYGKENLSLSRKINIPDLANINNAIHSILTQGFKSDQPAKVSFSEQKIYSMDQAFFDLNASYKWASGSIKGSFSTKENETYSKYLVRFVQKYFTVSCQAPSSPTEYIAKDANYEDLKKYISNDTLNPNPLCYVSSVTYGRELWLLIESKESAKSLEAALNASFSGVGASGEININDSTKKILKESSIQSFIMGGGKKAALDYLSGDKILGLTNFIKAGDSLLESDPPQPISYQVSYLSDNTPARISLTTDYNVSTTDVTNKPQDLVSVNIHFDNGDDGKDQNTGLRIYLFDNKTLGKDFIHEIPNLTSEVARLDFYDDKQRGVQFSDNSTKDFPMALKQATTDALLKNGVLVIWCFMHGHDTWRFTAILTLTFRDGTTKDIRFEGKELDQNNGIGAYAF